jgi:hypothetical protein
MYIAHFLIAAPKWYFARVKYFLACVPLVLAACHERRPPAPSAEQSAQLNDAEAMLNDMATNEEGPADRSAGPSSRSR